jgi:N-acetylglucosaminyl-diphospho-decaprenol L-rhamnosyltransferase
MAVTRRRNVTNIARREEPVEPDPAPQPAEPEEAPGPKVSAILVAHNQAPALRRAIEALERSADRERLEILVVDCGSQDGSGQLDEEFSGVTVLRLPHHFGATKAMNIGIRTAKADLVLYLAPEVEVAPDTVGKLAERLEADEYTAAACPLLVDEEGQPKSRASKIPTSETFSAACSGKEIPGAEIDLSAASIDVEYPGRDAILVRKQFIKGMNYFDERYGHYWADADLAMKVLQAQKKIRLYPGIRATIHPAPDDAASDSAFAVDRALGAAHFLGKYNGFFAGLGFRIAAMLKALAGFRLGEVAALISGQKVDGSQSA